MLSDIVIAQAAKMLPIAKVAEKLGLTDEDLIPYGRYKAPCGTSGWALRPAGSA